MYNVYDTTQILIASFKTQLEAQAYIDGISFNDISLKIIYE